MKRPHLRCIRPGDIEIVVVSNRKRIANNDQTLDFLERIAVFEEIKDLYSGWGDDMCLLQFSHAHLLQRFSIMGREIKDI